MTICIFLAGGQFLSFEAENDTIRGIVEKFNSPVTDIIPITEKDETWYLSKQQIIAIQVTTTKPKPNQIN